MRLQAVQLQRQLQLAEAELARMSDSSTAAEQRLAAMHMELAATQDQAAAAQSALEAAARDASQVL